MKNCMHTYSLIDSGNGYKLEQFGPYTISRPCSQAVWEPRLSQESWDHAHAFFSREGQNKWTFRKEKLPDMWQIKVADIAFKISPTDFGHLGIFPEQRAFWKWIQSTPIKGKRVLNLFAYSGGSTLAAAQAGAEVCHLDASKGMVAWARENAALNHLEKAPIRWIIDDVFKFLGRELRRGSRYDAIILDPPSFGRGANGEVFKIEEEINKLLRSCRELLTPKPLFILFSCHTPGFSPLVMKHLLHQNLDGLSGTIDEGEMLLEGSTETFPIPSGTFARWQYAG
ncbi:Putative uncharacterized protein [Neochlamydia sp. S13]|nr:Putative uncharacterized protein [Neochlamydia sp. S13]